MMMIKFIQSLQYGTSVFMVRRQTKKHAAPTNSLNLDSRDHETNGTSNQKPNVQDIRALVEMLFSSHHSSARMYCVKA